MVTAYLLLVLEIRHRLHEIETVAEILADMAALKKSTRHCMHPALATDPFLNGVHILVVHTVDEVAAKNSKSFFIAFL